VFAHLKGVNHVYVDGRPISRWRKSIVSIAKMRRTGVCGAAETLRSIALARTPISSRWSRWIVPAAKLRATTPCSGSTPREELPMRIGNTEYLDAIIAAKVVDGVDGAIAHIHDHGSHHYRCDLTEDESHARDSSTRWIRRSCCTTPRRSFADGGEFGFGAEIRHRHRQIPPAARSASSN